MITEKQESGNVTSSLEYFLKQEVSQESKILDIGCNFGSLIHQIYKKGYYDIEGIDINKEHIDIGKNEYPSIQNKLQYYNGQIIPFKNATFDVVLMFDVIEHIPNVEEFLLEVYRILKKDGIFIFQTPNKYISIPWEIIVKKSFLKWKSYHCSLQTKTSLTKILKNIGFQDIIIQKNNILTKYNKNKVKRKLGILGVFALYFSQGMPLFLYPNLWGTCKK